MSLPYFVALTGSQKRLRHSLNTRLTGRAVRGAQLAAVEMGRHHHNREGRRSQIGGVADRTTSGWATALTYEASGTMWRLALHALEEGRTRLC